MKLFWTPIGLESLKEYKEFLIRTWDEKMFDEFSRKLTDRLDLLKENPNLGQIFDDGIFRRLVLHKNSSLFYKIESDYIKLLLIWDNRQNLAQLERKLISANIR